MFVSVNDSPFNGREGKLLTSRQIKERLEKELKTNVALRVEPTDSPETFKISGRGQLHLGILMENMRREGFELQLSAPEVIYKMIDGKKYEPMEHVIVDVDQAYQGVVIERLGIKKAVLKDMQMSTLGIWIAHGEGRCYWPSESVLELAREKHLAPIRFVDELGSTTEQYPDNPNGSKLGITALCSEDGRHLAMMPHPERLFLKWQWPYWPKNWSGSHVSPWLKLFQNAREWCEQNQ